MTYADDAGLTVWLRNDAEGFYGHGARFIEAANRLETQAKEIEELRRQRDTELLCHKQTDRDLQATQAALADALTLLRLFAYHWEPVEAFLAKHGGRSDG